MSATTNPSAAIKLENVTKRFGDTLAVNDVSVHIKPGEFFSLLGPSGCGKTTLLRMIAGFEQPDTGTVHIGDRDVTRQTPQARPTAMVFQSYALFPTMTVGENVAYGLKVQKQSRPVITQRVTSALARVGMAGLEKRPVTQLSGGQQQRVALARALAVQPEVLLFDEPLSNLDVALREKTRAELKLLQHELGTTSLYVTHDQQEALALSDRIAVMREGTILQVGPPEKLYSEPDTAFVAQFLGGSNIIENTSLAVRFAGNGATHGEVLAIRPEHLHPVTEGGIEAKLRARQFLGTHAEWTLDVEGTELRAFVPPGTKASELVRVRASQWRLVKKDT